MQKPTNLPSQPPTKTKPLFGVLYFLEYVVQPSDYSVVRQFLFVNLLKTLKRKGLRATVNVKDNRTDH